MVEKKALARSNVGVAKPSIRKGTMRQPIQKDLGSKLGSKIKKVGSQKMVMAEDCSKYKC